MKALLILIMALAFHVASAESTNSPPSAFEQSLQTEVAKLAGETLPTLETTRFDQIQVGKLTYSGILIEFANLLKYDNALELLNPAAPLRYGSGEENLVLDPITFHISGLKFFSIQFWLGLEAVGKRSAAWAEKLVALSIYQAISAFQNSLWKKSFFIHGDFHGLINGSYHLTGGSRISHQT